MPIERLRGGRAFARRLPARSSLPAAAGEAGAAAIAREWDRQYRKSRVRPPERGRHPYPGELTIEKERERERWVVEIWTRRLRCVPR